MKKDMQNLYLAKTENIEKDYAITFMRKDGEYRRNFRVNADDLGKTIIVQFRRTEK